MKWFKNLFHDDYASQDHKTFREEQKRIRETKRENETLRSRVRGLELRMAQLENYIHQLNERYYQ